MAAQEEIRKYLDPALSWLNRQLANPKISILQKKKLILFREFIMEQMPNENSRHSTR